MIMADDPLDEAARRWKRAGVLTNDGFRQSSDGWDEASIPPRPWVVRGYLMRGAVTVLSGPGSAGKSSLTNLWCSALTLVRQVGGFRTQAASRVITYNVEDDQDEQKRRFSGLSRVMRFSIDNLMANLRICGPTEVGTLYEFDRDQFRFFDTKVMECLAKAIEEFKPDVLFLDPFVELHTEDENDNTAVRSVMASLRSLSQRHNMAVCVLHHTRKGALSPGDPDSLRGASAIVGAARVVLTLNVMTEQEADAFGINVDERRSYFRLDGAKSNYAPVESAEWFERIEVTLANGDVVAVASPWNPPNMWKLHTPAQLNLVLDRIAAGPQPGSLYSPNARGNAARWVGNAVTEVLGLSEAQAGQMVGAWLKSGLLKVTSYRDQSLRKDREGIVVCNDLRPL